MPLSPGAVRGQLNRLKPLMSICSLDTLRKTQDRLGDLMESRFRSEVMVKNHTFTNCDGAWILPKEERRQGVILYFHGGGYTCGSLEYAKGFGATLAVQCGMRVVTIGYRLAPENPAPAALEDALEAYQYLLEKGYAPEQIALCGESAGGGLCYSLCLRLKELSIPMPGCIIALSPWVDLTFSGESIKTNAQKDPSLSEAVLRHFAKCYTDSPADPTVSPLLGDLSAMPPSSIFVGSDEILLSDSLSLHEKLTAGGCISHLTVTPERWHAYLLYGLKEDHKDFSNINQFLNRYIAQENRLRWMRLDNAAKIYPAATRKNWSNVFRLSATLTETVDTAILQSALDVTIRRFPSIGARLRRGIFWYYVQQLPQAPVIQAESSYPLTRMSRKEMRQSALRVIVHENRIAVEFFHALTDGTGGLIFMKTLVAEYLHEKYGVHIPPEDGVLPRLEYPSDEELEDSFPKYAGTVYASRKDTDAWHLSGTPETGDFLHLTCLRIPVDAIRAKAREYGVSVTVFLTAVMMQALQNFQKESVPNQKWRKPIKVLVPVNLRRLFPSKSLRNFAYFITPQIDPVLGEYTFEEICREVHHRMGLEATPKNMSSKIASNVRSEQYLAVRLMPLFFKNVVMKAVFEAVGERKSCLCFSNLGAVTLPDAMLPYVQRMDFILGTQASSPYNCGAITFGDTLYVNFVRNTVESNLEMHFYRVLQSLGLPAQAESNQRS